MPATMLARLLVLAAVSALVLEGDCEDWQAVPAGGGMVDGRQGGQHAAWVERVLDEIAAMDRARGDPIASLYNRQHEGDAENNDVEESEEEETVARHGDCSSSESQRITVEAARWTSTVDAELHRRSARLAYANWDYMTNITDGNAKTLEDLQNGYDAWIAGEVKAAKTFLQSANKICNKTTSRLIERLVYNNAVPIASNPTTAQAINHLINRMSEIYSTASVSKDGKIYRLDPELTRIMSESRDGAELLWAWEAWRNATGPPIKPLYAQLVRDMNEAARDNGFSNVGESWQMSDFETVHLEPMLDALYRQIKPFYKELHSYVRRKLAEAYPQSGIGENEPIPAHLLGDMWAQEWTSIADLVTPYPDVTSPDVTAAMRRSGYTPLRMFRTSEAFFTSLGLEPLSAQFWAGSMITRPTDGRQVVCHGSAEDFSNGTDFRIKMCTEVNAKDLQTVHHEMGHIEYFMLYRHQPTLFRTGANAAFHEAVGDTIALSVSTLAHLRALGLMEESATAAAGGSAEGQSINNYKQQINFLMQMALQKVAFIPFSYIVDKWRFAVFRGDVTPNQYNTAWWKMREEYQGMRAPVPRSKSDFDPGSKYHIPANVPYSRYFLSFISQFQFQDALCALANHDGPLHTCDIYKSTAAGDRLKSVLSLGASQPWPEAMTLFTGQPDFKVDSLLKYFRPLIAWLKVANRGSTVGWENH